VLKEDNTTPKLFIGAIILITITTLYHELQPFNGGLYYYPQCPALLQEGRET